MKLLLIKFPGTPRQCWGRRPGAGGVSAALRGRRNTLTLGLVVPPVKVAGIWAWGHSMGSLGVPDIPKFPPSPCASTCQLLPPANHPLASPEACAYPAGLVSSPPQNHLCFNPRIEVESVGAGVLALSLTPCHFTSLSLSFLIFLMGIIPVPASWGCCEDSGHNTDAVLRALPGTQQPRNTWWLVPLLCPLPFPHHPLIHRLTGRGLNPSLRDHPLSPPERSEL